MKVTLKMVGGPFDGAQADIESEGDKPVDLEGVFPLGDHFYTADLEAGTLIHTPEPDPTLEVAKMNNTRTMKELLEILNNDRP